MNQVIARTTSLDTATASRLRGLRDAAMQARVADPDDARRYSYIDGWDEEDAELGWVDATVVSRSKKRPH